MALEIIHTERSYIVVDSEKWQQPSLVRIIRQLQTKLTNARVARNAKLGALVTEDAAALLESLATHVPYTLHTGIGIATQARALAARIREALALEVNK